MFQNIRSTFGATLSSKLSVPIKELLSVTSVASFLLYNLPEALKLLETKDIVSEKLFSYNTIPRASDIHKNALIIH